MPRVRFVVRGVVQGVGYRWFVQRAAERLGLRGLARNLPDGTVEVLAEGAGEAVADLEEELKRGPRFAQVARVERSKLPHEVVLPNSFETG